MPGITLPEGFIKGASRFRNPDPDRPRILIPVRFDSSRSIEYAALDTGSTRCILKPETARALKLRKPSNALVETLSSRFGEFSGWIERVTLEFVVDDKMGGEGLSLEVRAFIPEPQRSSREYDGPNILGMLDLLEAMRFAVDPSTRLFYFGEREDSITDAGQ